jgi:molybdenum-dependent DNA-binding transcriptional regulator ModE
MVMESAARGVDLSYNIAWMRVVGRYNRDQKRWIREWRERERNKKKGEKMSVRLF